MRDATVRARSTTSEVMHEIVAARNALIDAKVAQVTDNSPDNMTATYRAEAFKFLSDRDIRHDVDLS